MKKRRRFLRPGVVKGLCRKMIRKISVNPLYPLDREDGLIYTKREE